MDIILCFGRTRILYSFLNLTSDNKSAVTNYRIIAKLSAIPKMFEKLIADFLVHHTSTWFPSCSTTTTNVNIHKNFAFSQRKQTDVIFTIFSKAFDGMNHKLLLTKMDSMGVNHRSLRWLESYLTGRKQTEYVNNRLSKYIYMLIGVPQGGHLGPLLFSLFMNDLPNMINFANILMNADDIKVFLSFNNFLEHAYLQSDLNNFFLWWDYNMMELNIKKCKCMRF